jgi:hypothetical protein
MVGEQYSHALGKDLVSLFFSLRYVMGEAERANTIFLEYVNLKNMS